MPWTTPIRLTSITHRQFSIEMASMPPPAATPALLHTDLDVSEHHEGRACGTLNTVRDGHIAKDAAYIMRELAQAIDGGIQRRTLDVGEHHLPSGFGKGAAECEPDAGSPTRHEGRLAREFPHDFLPFQTVLPKSVEK